MLTVYQPFAAINSTQIATIIHALPVTSYTHVHMTAHVLLMLRTLSGDGLRLAKNATAALFGDKDALHQLPG